jgi:hypothetical protein
MQSPVIGEDDARRLLKSSIVVPDVSWLYGRALGCELLPDEHQYLVTEVALREAVTATRETNRRAAQMTRILSANRRNTLVGLYWQDIDDRERSLTAVSGVQDIVHWDLTRDAQSSETPVSVLQSRACDLIARGPDAAYERYRDLTVEIAELFISQFRDSSPESVRRTRELGGLRAIVREPAIVVSLVARWFPERSSAEWCEALAVFPDRFAIGRWHRLTAWIILEALRRGAAPLSHEMMNFFDDAHYAFLASYAGTLLTRDRGLARMTTDVFPNVRVLRDLPDERWPLDQ